MGPGHHAAGAEIRNPPMLPGLRFLFAAILLSASVLVFGLGAAALLRATHEEYVSNPSWRNGPKEQVFAQGVESAQPVLAVLRAEPEVAAEPAPSLRDLVPTIGLPVSEPEAVATEASVQPEPQVAEAAPAAEPQVAQVAEATPAAEPPATETATAEAAEPAKAEIAAPTAIDTLTPADTTASIPEAKPPMPDSSETQLADAAATLASSALDIASARVVALNDTAITTSQAPPAREPKAEHKAKAEHKPAKPQAHHAKKRHRIVRRAPPPPVQQQQLNPFGQPAFAATTARTR
jgi:hypothetical protein